MESNKKFSSILIKDCSFSTRLTNSLLSAGIKNLDDLMEADLWKLMRVRNFGVSCKEEVEKFIYDFQQKEEQERV